METPRYHKPDYSKPTLSRKFSETEANHQPELPEVTPCTEPRILIAKTRDVTLPDGRKAKEFYIEEKRHDPMDLLYFSPMPMMQGIVKPKP